MNQKNLCGSPGSAAVRAVRASVCGSAHGSVRAVRAAVCGSILGSLWQCARQRAAVWQCSSLQQWAAVGGSAAVRQCAAVCGSAAVRVQQCGSVRQCAALCGSACVAVWQCATVRAAVCGSVRQCVAVRMAVCGSTLYLYIHKVAHNILLVCPFRGGGNEPHIPRMLILTDQQYELLIRITVN